MIPGGRMISTPTVMPPTNDTLRRGRCPQRPASGQRPPLQYTQHPFTISRRGRPMWRPAKRRARRPGAPRRYNNAPSSIIAFGDDTFPPGWGRLVGCVLQASPLRGEAGERSETDEGADGRRTGDISPPGEVLSMDGKYPKIPGPSSSQSTLHSERPGVGIPRCAPLLVLSQPRPLRWVVVGFLGAPPPMISGPGAHVWKTV